MGVVQILIVAVCMALGIGSAEWRAERSIRQEYAKRGQAVTKLELQRVSDTEIRGVVLVTAPEGNFLAGLPVPQACRATTNGWLGDLAWKCGDPEKMATETGPINASR